MIDLHVHTSLCRHASGEPEDYVRAAARRGLKAMAFTDHLPLPEAEDPGYDYTMAPEELPLYVEQVVAAAESATGVEVRLGAEADWWPGRTDETAAMLSAHPFDVVLGSVHFIDGWAFDDPRLRERYADWDADDLWRRYFDEFVSAAKSGLFDVMAHPDLVKKFNVRPDDEPLELYDSVAASLASVGVAIELSTAGLRKPCAEFYPGESFLLACRRHGVPVTLGSDAHSPSEVGHAFEEAVGHLLRVGYEHIGMYRERVREEVALR